MQARRFLITGGSQGIGAALVARARTAGHTVVFTGRNARAIEHVAVETGAFGFVADVGKSDDNAGKGGHDHSKGGDNSSGKGPDNSGKSDDDASDDDAKPEDSADTEK